MAVKQYVTDEKEYLISLRRYFHSHPEVSLKEYNTCKRIEEELDQLQIPHKRVGETGVCAWIDGEKNGRNSGGISTGLDSGATMGSSSGKMVALRADIDALAVQDLKDVPYHSLNDGYCHACGHDAHAATLLTAAKILKGRQQEFDGQIRLFFQQAEEIGQGARLFVQEGLLNGVNRVFGVHVSSGIESGKLSLTKGPQNASCDYFKIRVTGKGAHVSKPHLGIDAAYVAAQIVVNLQSIVARSTNPLDTVVVGVGVIKAGTQYNIIAEHAEIEGTTRSFTPEVRKFTNGRVVELAKQIAAVYGAEAEVEFRDYAAPLVNDLEAVDEVTEVVKKFLPEDRIISDREKELGADDFADYLAVTKGMYAFIGTHDKENLNTGVAHHHGLFDVDEEALLVSCNAYVDYALAVVK